MFRFFHCALFSLALSLPLAAQANNAVKIKDFGKWTAYYFIENGQKVCYMTSAPVTDAGNYTQRGQIAAFITHWPSKTSKDVFSYVAGYTYKKDSDVTITVGGQKFSLFTQGEMAWASDEATDKRLISAIKRGSNMIVKGTSSRGTLTTDTYSLDGSTAAYNAITAACK